MNFWDSSALVPLFVTQAGSQQLGALANDDPDIVTSWITQVECWSAFARLVREGEITSAEAEDARRVLSSLAEEMTEVALDEEARSAAGRLLRMHPLRASDSLQLASAILWARGHPDGHVFICLDSRLAEAARLEGFTVLPSAQE